MQGNGNGWQEIVAGLGRLEGVEADAPALMDGICDDIVEDNRVGVLEGTDGWGRAAPKLQYRNGRGKATKPRKGNRYGVPTLHHYLGPELDLGHAVLSAAPENGNLTTAQYQKLTGPRLAPSRARSRSIANLIARNVTHVAAGLWVAAVGWVNVVSRKGVPFLAAHFNGENGLPRYDLRHVRPKGVEAIGRRVKAWAAEKLKGA